MAEHAVVRILAESSTLSEATPALLEAIAATLGWRVGALWEADDQEGVLRCVDSWRAADVALDTFEETTRSISFAPGVGLPGRVWASGEPAWVADVTEDQNFPRSQSAGAAGLRGAFASPITSGKRVFGVIEFFTDEAREPDVEVLETMAALGGQIGQFIERMRAEEEVRQSEAVKSAIVESALDCVITIDHEGRVTEFNPAAEATFGYRKEDAIGRVLADLIIPPSLREHHSRALDRYIATEQARVLNRRLELTGMRSDGTEFPVELTVTRIGDREPPMFAGYIRDITERRRNEEALRFLADTSAVLDSSLELDTTLRNIPRLAIPYLADICALYLRENGEIRQVGAAAEDGELERALGELRRFPIDPEGAHPAAKAIKAAELQVVPQVSDTLRESIARDARHLELLSKAPDPHRGVVIPLKARTRVLGAIAFYHLGARSGPNQDELSLMEEVARRSATVIDNAQLYTDSSHAARTLQQSLLPSRLPHMPGAELAAQFRAAQSAPGIGGDFYDVFQASGRWVVAIGDSYGKGTQAAATTALVRYMLRAAAGHESDPAQILKALNNALRWEAQEPRFCTVVVGVVENDGGEMTVSLASGGHPLPLLLRSDGQVGQIGVPGTLLGVVPEPQVRSESLRFKAGDALVFYTDGVMDGHVGDGEPEPDRLAAIVQACAGLDAEAISERIDRKVASDSGGEPRDDAAVLVLRALEPEPREAEPNLTAPGVRT